MTQLQAELDNITDEANRRIEKGNDAIVRLKTQLKEQRDNEEPQAKRERAEAEQRLETARARRAELDKALAERERRGPALDEELEQLRQEVKVLSNQKGALMGMVQDIYR